MGICSIKPSDTIFWELTLQVQKLSLIHIYKEATDEIDRIAKVIEETLNTETNSKVYISSGTVVGDLKDVSRSYKEAKMALEVGKIFETRCV